MRTLSVILAFLLLSETAFADSNSRARVALALAKASSCPCDCDCGDTDKCECSKKKPNLDYTVSDIIPVKGYCWEYYGGDVALLWKDGSEYAHYRYSTNTYTF